MQQKKVLYFFSVLDAERENIVESDNKQSINRWTENDVTINWYSTGYSIVVNTLPIIRSLHYQWVCPKRRANEIKKTATTRENLRTWTICNESATTGKKTLSQCNLIASFPGRSLHQLGIYHFVGSCRDFSSANSSFVCFEGPTTLLKSKTEKKISEQLTNGYPKVFIRKQSLICILYIIVRSIRLRVWSISFSLCIPWSKNIYAYFTGYFTYTLKLVCGRRLCGWLCRWLSRCWKFWNRIAIKCSMRG